MTPLLQVFDMATSLRFYGDALGFEIISTDQNTVGPDHNWVWLRLNEVDLMLNTSYEYGSRPSAPEALRISAHQDTALFFAVADVDTAYAQLRDKGIEVQPPRLAPYGMKQIYLRDPDGFELCFQARAAR